jgi:predicted DNA-binding protein YlxM (UPF0122 family)
MGQIADEKQARKDAISDNIRRAERASTVLEEYDIQTEGDTAAVDLLADIRHLCRMNRWDFENLLRISADHFAAEIEEE